jgi:hypothetical protein
VAVDPLTDTDRAILDLEAKWFATSGGKDEAIRALGLTPVTYYRKLNLLIDRTAALTYNPVVVHRLLRLRSATHRRRPTL